ncbi:MAG: glycerol-3-phosphate acyltransferase [Bacteroidota bacterium]
MDILEIIVFTVLAYLLGSIPTAIWLGKLRYGIDIREHGRGEATHTNVYRILGPRAGLAVQFADLLKGFLAAGLALFVHTRWGWFSDIEYPLLSMSFGLAAVMGHIFPLFAGFRGGKGFHVSLGVLLAVNPAATAVVVGMALIIYLLFRYPQLGYLVGGIALPVFVLLYGGNLYGDMMIPMLVFTLGLGLILFLTYRPNVLEIWREEGPFIFR